MKNKNKVIFAIIFVVALILVSFFFFYDFRKESSFEVDSVFLKLVVKEGDSLEKEFLIKNFDSEGSFKISSDLDYVLIEDGNFKLGVGESKAVNLKFNLAGNDEGVYLGNIFIEKGNERLEIPIVLEIESEEVLFDSVISIPPEYSGVYVGSNLFFENKVFNLENIGSKNVRISYLIKSFDGKLVFSEEENVAVENQALITKTIPISKHFNQGDYVLIVITHQGDSFGTSTYNFEVSKKDIFLSFNFNVIIILIIFVFIILFVFYNIRQRDKFLLELNRQRKREIECIVGKLEKKKGKVKGGKARRDVKKEERREIRVVNRIYRERKGVLKKLSKKKKTSEMKRKLSLWKKQGYNIGELEVMGGKISKKDIKSKSKKFKKEGYKL
ncbi:MAG: hypothetical protein HN374_04845 [Cryomorphaceae bacterium]|jgi:hypothetical protein|nr:hypothetical protein [Cryomorphaceae bacterium]